MKPRFVVPKAKQQERRIPLTCPLCSGLLLCVGRVVHSHRGGPRTVPHYVCAPCGVRVVLHAHPPRVTSNDRRFGS